MSNSFYAAADEIREAATTYRLPGPRKKFLWATILSQVAKRDTCDGNLADLLLEIIREYVKELSDEAIISMWLQTETGCGDNPGDELPESIRPALEMEFLAEVTRTAWAEARPPEKKKKRR